MKKAGLVGCGTIGREIALAIDRRQIEMELLALCDIELFKADLLKKELKNYSPKILPLPELIKKVDFVIEAASKDVVPQVLRLCLKEKRPLLIMSIGGLLSEPELLKEAQKEISIYLPSGALAGLDAIKGAKLGNIKSACLTTTKPPRGLEGAPYIREQSIDLKAIKERQIIFKGNAAEAVKGFPQNVNVAAILSLAGLGAEKTQVTIVVDPKEWRNCHEIEIEGDFGRIITRTENLPSPQNPKTSFLAILSAIATLKGITSPLKIGT